MAWNREKPKPASREAVRNAPRLRRSLTDAERRLWTALRKELSEMPDTHFRRQVAIGPYVADFVCFGRRLIIEVDGEIHADPRQRMRDAERDGYLAAQDFRVLRFKNRDVMLDIGTVIRAITVQLGRHTPTPSPSPQGGGVRGGTA